MADRTVSTIAPAKINLYLHVVGERSDGYHFLDSLVAFAGIQDLVSAAPAKNLSLAIDGPFSAGLPGANGNLVLKAARELTETWDVGKGAAIRLTKRLPVAAGMGGGSADAAAALKILSQLWNLNPANDALMGLALRPFASTAKPPSSVASARKSPPPRPCPRHGWYWSIPAWRCRRPRCSAVATETSQGRPGSRTPSPPPRNWRRCCKQAATT